MVSEYTEEDANGFSDAPKPLRGTQWTPQTPGATQNDELAVVKSGRDARARPDVPASRGPSAHVKRRYVYPLCRDVQAPTRTRLRNTLDSVGRGVNG